MGLKYILFGYRDPSGYRACIIWSPGVIRVLVLILLILKPKGSDFRQVEDCQNVPLDSLHMFRYGSLRPLSSKPSEASHSSK